MIARRAADQAGHADIVGIVIFDEVLAARGVRDRRLEPGGSGDQRVMRAPAAAAGIDGDGAARIENLGDLVELGITGTNDRPGDMDLVGPLVRGRLVGDVGGHDQHGHAAFGERCLAGRDGLAARLVGSQDRLAVHAAALEDLGEIDFLDRLEADVAAHDLGGDEHHRRAVAIGFVEAVDEMEAAGTAAACAGDEALQQHAFAGGGKGARFLMAHVDEVDAALLDRMSDAVHRVADNAVAVLDPRFLERFDQDIGDSLAHGLLHWVRRSRQSRPDCGQAGYHMKVYRRYTFSAEV